jgi:hypothetical protein
MRREASVAAPHATLFGGGERTSVPSARHGQPQSHSLLVSCTVPHGSVQIRSSAAIPAAAQCYSRRLSRPDWLCGPKTSYFPCGLGLSMQRLARNQPTPTGACQARSSASQDSTSLPPADLTETSRQHSFCMRVSSVPACGLLPASLGIAMPYEGTPLRVSFLGRPLLAPLVYPFRHEVRCRHLGNVPAGA